MAYSKTSHFSGTNHRKAWLELAKEEHRFLRNELQHLKHCQITFLTLSVTATGALIGIGRSKGIEDLTSLILLAPLVILVPAWFIFFDKAGTITRGVGYYRLLESFLAGNCIPKWFPGWENALRWGRLVSGNKKRTLLEKRFKRNKKVKRKEILNFFFLKTSHQYWSMNFYIFTLLTAGCWVLSLCVLLFQSIGSENQSDSLGLISLIVLGIFLILVLFTFVWNVRKLVQLVFGKYSYVANGLFWHWLLVESSRTDALEYAKKECPDKLYTYKGTLLR